MKNKKDINNEYQLIEIHQQQDVNIECDQKTEQDQSTENIEELTNQKDSLIEDQIPVRRILRLQICWKNFQDQINQRSKKIWSCFSLAITLLVWYLYQTMKEECPYKSDFDCLRKFILENLTLWIILTAINSICITIQLHILLEKKANILLPLISLFSAFYILILGDQTISLNYYIGGINALHIVFCVVMFMLYGLMRMWQICYKKYKRLCLITNFLVITVSFLIFFINIQNSCDYWDKGINGQIETTNPNMCQIKIPSYCWYKITDNWQNLSIILRPSCKEFLQDSSSYTKIFDNYFEKSVGDSQFIGFKNLNQESEEKRSEKEIQNTVFDLAKGYLSLQDAQKDGHDVVFDRKKKVYNIEILRNETLVNEREQLRNSSALEKNVLLIFVDAVSRSGMHLKLPKTINWFKKRSKFHSYQTNSTNQNNPTNQTMNTIPEGESFEFYRYNSFVPFTFYNVEWVLYGNSSDSYQFPYEERWKGIVEEFKQQGFITGHTSDMCQTSTMGNEEVSAVTCKQLRYDHETQSYACDPNYKDPLSHFGLFQGPYSIVDRCLYGRSLLDLNLDYAKSFLQKYSDQQKFMHIELQYGHEVTGEVIKRLDDPLFQFLEETSSNGLLDDTVIILMSDHGLHTHGILHLLNLEVVFNEINLPGLFIHLPQKTNSKYRKGISENQQNLITTKNLHYFLKDILYGENGNSTLSLLSPLNNQTSCIKAGVIANEYCSCF